MRRVLLISLVFLFISAVSCSWAQDSGTEEHFEEEIDIPFDDADKPVSDFSLSASAEVNAGYDTNVNLNSTHKGDAFEEFLFTLDFKKPVTETISFFIDYYLDYFNYNEFIRYSSLINHIALTASCDTPVFTPGIGYDFSSVSYLNYDDADFLFHRSFVYLENFITRKILQRLTFEYGYKDYLRTKALADEINLYQDDERADTRIALVYSLFCKPTRKTKFFIQGKVSKNDSNSRYVDFYDYNAYRIWLGGTYSIYRNLALVTDFSFKRKVYKSRTVTSEDFKQKDKLYTTGAGFIYKMSRADTVSLNYTYRQNNSNEPLEEYSENIIQCGFRHNF